MTRTDQRRRNYTRARALLERELGGRCRCCGRKTKLEFHHVKPRTWQPSRTARWVRLARYRREWLQGLVELLCRSCNARAGKPQAEAVDIPW